MDMDQFWALIEPGKNSDAPEVSLEQQLSELSADDLVAFQKAFDSLFDKAYKWDLWGAAYLIGGGCSDDGFIDFRYGLISRGREVYEQAIAGADALAMLGGDAEVENESFGYVAQEVYETKASAEMPRTASEAPDDPLGEEWDFDDVAENELHLPRLAALYQ